MTKRQSSCWVWDHTMMGERPAKSIKPEANIIQKKKSPLDTQSFSAIEPEMGLLGLFGGLLLQ